MSILELRMTCHCGALEQPLRISRDLSTATPTIKICHCYGCRHSTGLLYASYYSLPESLVSGMDDRPKMTKYVSMSGPMTKPKRRIRFHFCSTCGCQAFRELIGVNDVWGKVEVASGTITHGIDLLVGDRNIGYAKFGPQISVGSTIDGGISIWTIDKQASQQESGDEEHAHIEGDTAQPGKKVSEDGVLTASCLCQQVTFRVSRPNERSRSPTSNFPDLMMAYHTQNPMIANPENTKWWLRQDATKYLAGLCACKSCRLTSGFEIQSWAFIPRVNIFFNSETVKAWETLDFDDLHNRGVLRGYESSPGVMREFCPTCGATVFWHDKWRPDLIDVSVGLFQSPDGARAESWLDWWTERISFVEDAELDRQQSPALRARHLLAVVESQMRTS